MKFSIPVLRDAIAVVELQLYLTLESTLSHCLKMEWVGSGTAQNLVHFGLSTICFSYRLASSAAGRRNGYLQPRTNELALNCLSTRIP